MCGHQQLDRHPAGLVDAPAGRGVGPRAAGRGVGLDTPGPPFLHAPACRGEVHVRCYGPRPPEPARTGIRIDVGTNWRATVSAPSRWRASWTSRALRIAAACAVTPGVAGADLRNLVNEAALLAARRNQNEVHQKDFLDALEKIVLGPERPLLLSREEREGIAYHEGGHAILGLVIPGADPVHRVSIVPRGEALGVTYQRPDSDRYNYPEDYLRGKIIGAIGGRAAEELVFGTKTTGAQSDIEQASAIARNMVTRW